MKKFLIALMMTVFASSAFAAGRAPITLTPQNMIALRDEVTDETVSRLILQLTEYQGDTVYLFINSPGGSVVAGNHLMNAIQASGKKVVCVASFAASMAFSILQSCTERLVVPAATVMQHQMSYGVEGSVTHIRTQVEFAEKLAVGLNTHDAARIGITVEELQKRTKNEWWLYGDEIVKANVADDVALVRCSPALAKKREIQVVESLFGSATLTWSSCPLATYPLEVKLERKNGVDLKQFHDWASSLAFDRDWVSRKEVK